MSNQKIRIEIWSDMVCPFCYIGKKKIERAIVKLGLESRTEIIWHSYQLDPDFPENTSTSATRHLMKEKGISERQLKEMYQHLERSGAPYGINFRFDSCLSFNTLNTHRLWHWSKKYNKATLWKETVMQAYFTEGSDLSKQDVLLHLASMCSLPADEAKTILASNAFEKEVMDDIKQAAQIGVRGVPYFLINGTKYLSGAQDDKIFENALLNVE